MGAVRRHNSPTGIMSHSPKSECRVGFAEEIVTGYSRPLSNHEQWTLYYFEEHARQCPQCHDPLRVHKLGKQLCDRGHEYAVDVARFAFYSRSRDGVFARTKESQQEVRIEVPPGYTETLGLLKAVQRAMRNGERFVRPRSYDKTYLVPPRHADISNPEHSTSSSDEEKSSRRVRASDYEVKLVEPKESQSRARSRRGSLYCDDREEWLRTQKREQRLLYNLEVREPTTDSHRRHG